MKTNDIRNQFLKFFAEKGHKLVSSSPLVPANDPTLLFTNAGMVQFKDVFLGREKRDYMRAASSQKCVRAGGKHNDLDNVGHTARHHTFFEMLGNFSFGDYFKRDAIQFAWQFLTEVLQLPAAKLWVTVYEDDDEAANIWLKEIGVDAKRFSRCGEKDNFWAMGDTGPCGPCSEIFYDHGPEIPGGPPGSPDADGDRYIEIWNLVFMQFNRSADGQLTPLPKPSVDTGMGLERIAAVMQGVHNNYEIDLFSQLVKAIADITKNKDLTNSSLRVIADHIRSCSFLIIDGVVPSNEGRGYVLRRIVRRAIRHGYKLGVVEPFFYRVVNTLVKVMGDAYPELKEQQKNIEKILLREEEQFAITLTQGMKLLEESITNLSGNVIPGDVAFKLYDTYGFPLDLTADIARERELTVDLSGFELAMAQQRSLSQQASQFKMTETKALNVADISTFHGYELLDKDAQILALYHNGELVDALNTGQQGIVILDHTPFYAESGGQVGDQGQLTNANNLFEVMDTTKSQQAVLHHGILKQGHLKKGDKIRAQVDPYKRKATMANHSATHLLHAALRQVLGKHVLQKGSLVEPSRLRFDFSHFEAVSAEQLKAIEKLVNEQIRNNHVIETKLMDAEQATAAGALALFGEKYGAQVRVLTMGDFSKELCGGTHVARTGEIGILKIISESGIAAGIRRIEALTGQAALDYFEKHEMQLQQVAVLLKTNQDEVVDRLSQQLQQHRELSKELQHLKDKLLRGKSDELINQAKEVKGIKLLVAKLDGADMNALRTTLDQLKSKLTTAIIVLASTQEQKVNIVVGVTPNCIDRVSATELIQPIAAKVGGRGGGRPEMAQAGGSNPEMLIEALQEAELWINNHI